MTPQRRLEKEVLIPHYIEHPEFGTPDTFYHTGAFFDLIRDNTGAKEVAWGNCLRQNNHADAFIHKELCIDGKVYEFRGTYASDRLARAFVEDLKLGRVEPYQP